MSTVSHDDAVLGHAKRHLRRDQDYSDNDHSFSDTREQRSYRPSSDNTDDNAEVDGISRRRAAAAQQVTHRRSNSPSRLDQQHSGTSPKAFNNNNNSGNDVDSSRTRRSDSFEDSHRQSAYGNNHWAQENASERSNTYPRSARSSDENYEAKHRHDANEGRMDEDEDAQRLQSERVGERRSPSGSNSQEGDDVDMQDDMMYDDDNMEDDDSEENEDGSGSRDDDESDPTKKVVGADLDDSLAMDGAVKPIKVRSMFVDKLYR